MRDAHSNGAYHHYPGEGPQPGGPVRDPLRDDPLDRDETNQLEHVLELLYRGRWIILVTFLIVFSAVAAYTYAQPEVYQANSLVLISNSSGGASGSGPQMFGFGTTSPFARSGNSLANQLLILRNSRDLARDVARRLQGMEHVPGAPLTVTTGAAGDSVALDRLAATIQGRVSFGTTGGETTGLRIAAASTVPAEAALLTNLYTEEYVRLTRDASRTSLASKRAFLEEQQTQWQDSLRSSEERLKAYMRREDAIALDQRQSIIVSQLGALEAERDNISLEMQTLRAERSLLRQRLAQIDSTLVARLRSSVDQNLRTAQEQLARQRGEKQQILLINPDLSPQSDRLADINGEIRRLEQQVGELAAAYVDLFGSAARAGNTSERGAELSATATLENQLAQQQIALSGLEARRTVLRDRMQQYQNDLNALPDRSMALARLERTRGYAETMYRMVTEALQRTRIAERAELGYASIISRAERPAAPVSPKKTRNLLAGFFGGLFLGTGLALMRYALDKRLYTPEDLHDMGQNVIGVVPDMEAVVKDEYGGADYVEQDGRRFATGLAALLNPLSPASESFRHLRTNIQFSFPDTVVETLLVTSSNKGEGKTLTAANLAVVMAQAGRRTLLVDTDLRRPRVHKMLGLNREPGLVEHLFDEQTADLAGAGPAGGGLATGIDHLHVLPAGQSVPNPAELLGSQSMRAFVEEAREHFDVIIFDTPPVLAATDAPLLSTQCDATIVVAQAAATRGPELDQTLKSLAGVGARVVGTLLNGFDTSMTYGYDYKYRYYAKNYYAEDDEEDAASAPSRLTRLLRR